MNSDWYDNYDLHSIELPSETEIEPMLRTVTNMSTIFSWIVMLLWTIVVLPPAAIPTAACNSLVLITAVNLNAYARKFDPEISV